MATGGETEDADALRIELPLGRVGAYEADRPRVVAHLDGVVIALGPDAVAKDESGHAVLREPFAHDARLVRRPAAVAAAGADDDGRARRLAFGREEHLHRGRIFLRIAQRAGRLARPEVDPSLVLELHLGRKHRRYPR